MVNFIRRIFDFYIFSNIHVAIAAFSLTKITLLNYGIAYNLLPFFIFFATIASYNFIRLYKIDTLQNWFFLFNKRYRKVILALTFGSVLLLLYFSFSLRFVALLALMPFGVFTLFYAVPFSIQKGTKVTLRSLAFLKLFLIAISWAGVTVLVPLLNYQETIDQDVLLLFIQRFLFVVVITIPFDIRDIKHDDKALMTLPQVLGIEQVKRLGLLFLMLFLGIELFKSSVESNQFRLHLLVAIVTFYFLFKSKQNQTKYYSAFFVESIPIIWLIFYAVS